MIKCPKPKDSFPPRPGDSGNKGSGSLIKILLDILTKKKN